MCGFTGFLNGRQWLADDAVIRGMTATLVHRGPDSEGVWIDSEAGVALGHRRLAIVDLSPSGHQPMVSQSGALVLAFNGEIYNHRDLRAELEATGARWRGGSDTETLLAAIESWGIEAALLRAVGMFSLALWNRRTRRLTLARDRLGEKPLYYGWAGDGADRAFLFGSELKALHAHPGFAPRLDRDALSLFMRLGYITGERTIYEDARRLPPASLLEIGADGTVGSPRPYWSVVETALAGSAQPMSAAHPDDAVDALERVLDKAVTRQMMADVPLGAFLSGGVDSSTVVALMQRRSVGRVRTFTIGFHEKAYDEAEHARLVAAHLGTEHTDLYVGQAEILAEVPRLPQVYDEPFADASQIPTLLVSRLTRSQVTVALSGDGADELFCGYPRYVQAARFWRAIRWVPGRNTAARLLRGAEPWLWDMASASARLFGGTGRAATLRHRLRRAAGLVDATNLMSLNDALVSRWSGADGAVIGGRDPTTPVDWPPTGARGLDDAERLMLADLGGYLPDDLLVKVDRAAMSVSLETRAPFLDPSVVAFAWRLPLALKQREGRSKWILRQVLERHVPREIVDRPKMGFTAPVGTWLKGPLRDWAESLLSEQRLQQEGYIRHEPIRRLWAEHLSGRSDQALPLWNALMFGAWLEATATVPKPTLAPSSLAAQ